MYALEVQDPVPESRQFSSINPTDVEVCNLSIGQHLLLLVICLLCSLPNILGGTHLGAMPVSSETTVSDGPRLGKIRKGLNASVW